MAQMNEQNKTPEKELHKMEIGNSPSDAEFKILVIRMLKELVRISTALKRSNQK